MLDIDVGYIVKLGVVNMVNNLPWLSFHTYVKEGVYPDDQGGKTEMKLLDVSRRE